MKHEIPCSVILDLLPLYTEGLLREENEKAVHLHMAACPSCREALREMQGDRLPAVNREAHLQEAKPLKKIRWRFWLNLFTFPLWLPLALVAISLILTAALLLLTVGLLLWCIPVVLGALTLSALPLLLQSVLLSLGHNALLSVGMLLSCLGGLLLSVPLCIKCSRWLFSAPILIFRRIFSKKAKTTERT